MVSLGPYNESTDFKHMYNFVDINNNIPKKKIYPQNSIMDMIDKIPDFSIFKNIVTIAKLDDKLSDIQANFTIFIPSDEQIKTKYSSAFIKNIDYGLARQILNISIMKGELDKDLLQSSPTCILPTMDRSNSIRINTVNNISLLQKDIKIIHFNHKCNNGIIHVIDKILLPFNSMCYR